MQIITIVPVGQAHAEVLKRLSKQWLGRGVSKAEVLRSAMNIGRVGRVAIAGDNREHVVGFVLATVDAGDVLNISWLVADPQHRLVVLKAILNSLAKEFPGFDLVVRVPNDETTKYEFLADLRDASWSDVTADPSHPIKVTDERASYVYVRVRGSEADHKGRRGHGRAKVAGDPGKTSRR